MEDITWVDKKGVHHDIREIDNRYLLNILAFIERGGGYAEYNSEELIANLFNEASKRGLQHNHSLEKSIEAYQRKFDLFILDDMNIM